MKEENKTEAQKSAERRKKQEKKMDAKRKELRAANKKNL